MDLFDLTNKTAIVTGACGLIGRQHCAALAAAGANVVVADLNVEACTAVAAELPGGPHLTVAVDVTSPESLAAARDQVLARFGHIDVLVNNAAIRHFAPIEETLTGDWNTDLAVNLSAAFHLIRLTLPGMRRRGWGRIVNMSSIYGLVGGLNRVGYVTTKTALIGLTRAVALETSQSGITCNAICAGTTLTPNIDGRIQAAMAVAGLSRDTAEANFLYGKNPSGRMVEARAIGAMAAFLCGEAGRDITGTALPMDGGWSAR